MNRNSFFVIRAKKNLQYKRNNSQCKKQYSAEVDESIGVLCNQTGEVKGFYPFKGEKVRGIHFHDKDQSRTLLFNQQLKAKPEKITALFRNRWKGGTVP